MREEKAKTNNKRKFLLVEYVVEKIKRGKKKLKRKKINK